MKHNSMLEAVHLSDLWFAFFLFDGLYKNAATSGAMIIASIIPLIGYDSSRAMNSMKLPINKPISIDVK